MKFLIVCLLSSLMISSVFSSSFDGKWKGYQLYSNDDNDTSSKYTMEITIYEDSGKLVGFFKREASGNPQKANPFYGYYNQETKRIIFRSLDETRFNRYELKLSEDGKSLIGGRYTLNEKESSIKLIRFE